MHIRVHDCSGGEYTFPARDLVIHPSFKDGRGCVSCHGKMIITRETREQLETLLAMTTKVVSMEDIGELELHPNVTCFDLTAEEKLLRHGAQVVNALAHKRCMDVLIPPIGPVLIKEGDSWKVRGDIPQGIVKELSEILDTIPGHEIAKAIDVHETYTQLMAGQDA